MFVESDIQRTMDEMARGINVNDSDIYLSTFTENAFFRPSVNPGVIGKQGKTTYNRSDELV